MCPRSIVIGRSLCVCREGGRGDGRGKGESERERGEGGREKGGGKRK